MKVTNKEILQSYVMTEAKYTYTAYEKRVLYRIIEVLQAETKGLQLKYNYSIQENLFNKSLKTFTLPISCFLKNEEDKHHTQVKKALRSLRNKTFEYEDESVWEVLGVIELPNIQKHREYVTFSITPRLYEAFLNFSKGFRKFELETAMKFESTYAMRFYELFSNKKEPIIYDIEKLKEMFGVQDNYKRINDFKRKVIDVAQKELKKSSPYSFKYEFIKTGRSYTHIKFNPYEIPKNKSVEVEKKNLVKQTSLRWDIPIDLINDLKRDFSFSEQEIKNNIEVFKKGIKDPFFKDFYSLMKGKSRTVKNPKGYFISSLKNMQEIE